MHQWRAFVLAFQLEWQCKPTAPPKPLSTLQSTPDNSNLQGKSKKVRVIGSSSYRELEENSRE